MSKPNLTQTELAYHHLKQKIQTCEYIPGQEIFEKQLYEELGYGRTPIREALLSLKRENLIDIFPRKGMIIKPILSQDIVELYQMRKIIDPTITCEYCKLYSKSDLLEFERLFKEEHESSDVSLESDIAFYQLDIKFHSFLINIAKNSFLNNTYQLLMEKQFRLAVFGAKTKASQRKINYTQHQNIISSLLLEDEVVLREHILTHINYSLVTSLKSIETP